MDSIENEVTHDFNPLFRVYKNGHVERITGTPIIPPSHDPKTSVLSKDVDISQDPKISARLYLPTAAAAAKLPLLIYIHGGGFAIESAFSTLWPLPHPPQLPNSRRRRNRSLHRVQTRTGAPSPRLLRRLLGSSEMGLASTRSMDKRPRRSEPGFLSGR
ncbi:hypothetical protein L2E82_02133 [Cichorium intybus]|uniref:Uncharacterized protein n=1 Tax=Cichorium intybus TaxID=13427 RepID=A0ACB9H1W6_CICIN|nr:hypothetical protein L2E82_02133 [Cichorium intybus]